MSPSERINPPGDLSQDSLATYEKLLPLPSESATLGAVQKRGYTLRLSVGESARPEESSSPTMAVPANSEQEQPLPSGEIQPAYHLIDIIGRGGMGEVWQAVQYSLGRTVAVKRLKLRRDETMPDMLSVAVRSFREEAFFSAQLEHPNIVPIHDLGEDENGSPLLAMKLIEGSEWSDVIKADFAELTVEAFLGKHIPILISVAQAVAFAHSKGIVHRDLKPQQVMLGGFGEVLLADWGLAIKVGSVSEEASPLPVPTPVILPGPETASSPSGTPAFMAPEQTLSSARSVGTWTDVFLLGGCLYLLLTGEAPHEGSSAHEVFLRANEGRIRTPTERVAGARAIPAELEELCLSCLKHEPKDRLGSAMELVERLKDYITGAGRRRESIALVAGVAETLSRPVTSYAVYADVLSTLDHARALWADNPDVTPLRGRALEGHARLALGGGDLRLARLQAEAMRPENPARAAVLAEVDVAEANVVAQARQRRLAVAGVIVLLALLLVGAMFSYRKISAERDIAEARRVEAEAATKLAVERENQVRLARADSEDMLDFVIGDLRESLMELDRIDLLNDAAERALAHYKRQPFDALNADERHKVVEGLRKLVDIFKSQSRFDLATESTSATLELIGREYSLDPKSKPNLKWARSEIQVLYARNDIVYRLTGGDAAFEDAKDIVDLAEAYVEIGHADSILAAMAYLSVVRALERTGSYREAFPYVEVAERWLELAETNASGDQGELDVLSVRSTLLTKRAALYLSVGDFDGAEEAATSLLNASKRRIELDPKPASGLSDSGEAYTVLSTVATAREKYDDAIRFAELGLEARQAALKGRRMNRENRANVATAYLHLTRRLVHGAKYSQAVERATESIRISEKLLSESNVDVLLLGNLSATYGARSDAYTKLGEPLLAIEDMRRSAELFSKVVELQPDAPNNLTSLSAIQTNLGYALLGANRVDESIAELEKGLAIITKAVEGDPTNPELLKRRGESLAFLSGSLSRGSRYAEAEDTAREAIRQLDLALEIKPDTESLIRLRRSFTTSLRSALQYQGKTKEALELSRGTAEEAYKAYLKNPGYYLGFRAYVSEVLAEWNALEAAEDSASAAEVIGTGTLRFRQYRQDYPEQEVGDIRYTMDHLWARTLCYNLGETRKAEEIVRHAYEDAKATGYTPVSASARGDVANVLYILAMVSGQARRGDEAVQYFDEAVSLIKRGIDEQSIAGGSVLNEESLCELGVAHAMRGAYFGMIGESAKAVSEFKTGMAVLGGSIPGSPKGSARMLRTQLDLLFSSLTAIDPEVAREAFPNWRTDATSTTLALGASGALAPKAVSQLEERIDRAEASFLFALGDYDGVIERTQALPPPEAYLNSQEGRKPIEGLKAYLDRLRALRAKGRDAEAAALEPSVRELYVSQSAQVSNRESISFALCEAAIEFGDEARARQEFDVAIQRALRSRVLPRLGAKQGWLSPEDLAFYRLANENGGK